MFVVGKASEGIKWVYHVQFFGKSTTHGWTNLCRFIFEGKDHYDDLIDQVIKSAPTEKQKKKLRVKYQVPVCAFPPFIIYTNCV